MKIDEKTGLYGNYGLWHTPFWQTQTFCFISLFVLGILIFIFVILLYRSYILRRKNKKLSSWDQALYDLRRLSDEQKVNAEHGKEFYVATTTILKTYLHQRYGYQVLSKTDDEMVRYLQNTNFDNLLIGKIDQVLQGSTIIKFANQQAAQQQINSDYETVISIIKNTIPKEKSTDK